MIEPSRLRIKSRKLVRAEAEERYSRKNSVLIQPVINLAMRLHDQHEPDHKRSDAGHDQKRPRRIKDQAVGEAADHEQNKNEESESPSTLLGVN